LLISNDFSDLLDIGKYVSIDSIADQTEIIAHKDYWVRTFEIKTLSIQPFLDEMETQHRIYQKSGGGGFMGRNLHLNVLKNHIRMNQQRILEVRANIHEFIVNYTKRIDCFRNILEHGRRTLFLRIEEELGDLNKIPEVYRNKYRRPEIEYVKDFSNLVEEKYSRLQFTVIFISKRLHNMFFPQHNLIVLNMDRGLEYTHTNLTNLFHENRELLVNCIPDFDWGYF